MVEFKVGDLVRFRRIPGLVQYCTEGSVLRVVHINTPCHIKEPDFQCQLVFGAWVDDYDHWPLSETATFYTEELEKIHDPQIQEG